MELFLVTAPGLENMLADEACALNFDVSGTISGGVTMQGDWAEVVRANHMLRGATRVLVRLAEFRAMHLAQLDKRARKLPWADWLRADVPVRVEAVCRKSRIYHHKAAAQRIERAVVETLGAPLGKDGAVALKVRIEDDLCTISVDTSGESLHKRGLKQQVNKAPMRETLAALFLRAAGFTGEEPVYDPMCGSGTFPIEAAEIALGLAPGRARSFAFENLNIGEQVSEFESKNGFTAGIKFFGSDRDTGAISMSKANAERSGVAHITQFEPGPISDITPPCEQPGLIVVNPPYGGRIGNKKPLYGLYAALGARLAEQFSGWRVALVTSEASLAKVTSLPWQDPGPVVNHGGIKVRLWQTGPLG